jgi:L-rhamnose mutarotase
LKTYAQTLCLQDDPAKIRKYVEYHQQVWTEVLDGLRSAGIQQMRIFLIGRRMFMYIQTSDDFEPDRDYPKARIANARAREWNEVMGTLQERAPEARPDQWWAPMDMVFDLNWPQHLPR